MYIFGFSVCSQKLFANANYMSEFPEDLCSNTGCCSKRNHHSYTLIGQRLKTEQTGFHGLRDENSKCFPAVTSECHSLLDQHQRDLERCDLLSWTSCRTRSGPLAIIDHNFKSSLEQVDVLRHRRHKLAGQNQHFTPKSSKTFILLSFIL